MADPRSFWGWGLAAKLPPPAMRLAVAQHLASLLGPGPEPQLAPDPQLETVRLDRARLEVPARLADFCSAADEARVRHSYGRGYCDQLRGFRGDFSSAPDLVARPRDEQDIERVFEWAGAARIAVIPWGGGTNVVGGVEAAVGQGYSGVLSLDLTGLDQVLEVDATARLARIQAGILGPTLERHLAPHGLTLRHYPQSFEFSTLGGWIATRSGGHYATGRTRIDDFVAGLRSLTPAGAIESRCLPASGAGPSADRWLMGGEGALGVISEAWLRVSALPRFRSKLSLGFGDFEAAVEACRCLVQSGLQPANARLLHRKEAGLFGVGGDCHVLLLGFESADLPQRAALDAALEVLRDCGGLPMSAPQHRGEGTPGSVGELPSQSWRKIFFEAPYLQTGLISTGLLADTFETCCSWSAFPALHAALEQQVGDALRRTGGGGLLSCRFTHIYPDGPAPYYTFITRAQQGAELEQWREIKSAACDVLLRFGATISHHHAVGRTHLPWYLRERPPLFGHMLATAKQAVDPAGILNPGVLVPLSS